MVPADVITPRSDRTRDSDRVRHGARRQRGGRLAWRLRGGPDLLSGQRPDDLGIIERRKADAMLLAVRHGAARR